MFRFRKDVSIEKAMEDFVEKSAIAGKVAGGKVHNVGKYVVKTVLLVLAAIFFGSIMFLTYFIRHTARDKD